MSCRLRASSRHERVAEQSPPKGPLSVGRAYQTPLFEDGSLSGNGPPGWDLGVPGGETRGLGLKGLGSLGT